MRKVKIAVILLIAALGAAQFIRPARVNPPVDPRASFESVAQPPQRVAAALDRACGDCHSDRTIWPWYSKVAPVSWLIASDVTEGRAKLNLSRWNIYGAETTPVRVRSMCKEMRSGEMPPWYYKPMHPGSAPTSDEIAGVCALAGI